MTRTDQQAAYESILLGALRTIYADETHTGVMSSLRRYRHDPAKVLAETAKMVLPNLWPECNCLI